jgi:hypothetical protein
MLAPNRFAAQAGTKDGLCSFASNTAYSPIGPSQSDLLHSQLTQLSTVLPHPQQQH